MYIDNQPATNKWMLIEITTIMVSLSLMLYAKFHDSYYGTCFSIAGVGLLAAIIMLVINPSYVYYNDEGKNIVIRTCSAFPLFRNYREYPFPKSSLVSFRTEEKFFGWKKLLHITVEGKDPDTNMTKQIEIQDINISALKKENIAGLTRALNKILGQ